MQLKSERSTTERSSTATDSQPNSKELEAALAALDLQAIIAIAESDDFMKVVSTRDPERELRSFRKANPRVCGIAMTLYVQNEVVAGRVIARGLELLEQSGTRRDGRWVGCKPSALEATLRDAADAIGASVLSTTERLLKGQRLLEQEAARR